MAKRKMSRKERQSQEARAERKIRRDNWIALLICLGGGLLLTAAILLGVDIYRKARYTAPLPPEVYRIAKIREGVSTSTGANGAASEDKILILTISYQVNGVSYTDTLEMLAGSEEAKTIYGQWKTGGRPEQTLGVLYYDPDAPDHIGRRE